MNTKHSGPVVYIDGENFMFRAAETLVANGKIKSKDEISTFDFRYLFEKSFLGGSTKAVIRYYGTRVKVFKADPYLETKTKKIIAKQRTLRNSLSVQDIEFVESGRLKVRDGDICRSCNSSDLHLQEKGVDVKIAVDIVNDSLEGRKLYVVSSDTDLLPAINASSAHIVYVGFPKLLTNALQQSADEVVVLRDSEIITAYDKANPQTKLV